VALLGNAGSPVALVVFLTFVGLRRFCDRYPTARF